MTSKAHVLVGLLSIVFCGTAADFAAGASRHAQQRELERLAREHALASRAAPPERQFLAPNIVQQPIDTSKAYLTTKAEWEQARANAPIAFPPLCPYSPGWKIASLFAGSGLVSWHICVRDMGAKALWVGPVEMRFAGGPWTTILYQAGLADIFVPYHVDTNARYYDLNPFAPLDAVTAQDAGPTGSLITLTNETHPTVVAETRDRGIGWLCKGVTQASYRSHEYVIWSVSDAGNYDNIVQYSFRDDGSIGFRMGNTGYNSPSHMLEAHMHNGLWRIDMDLKGSAGDSALWTTHNEPLPPYYGSVGLLRAQDSDAYMGVEGARSVSPPQFASLEIQDSSVNAYGHHPSYEFIPFEEGVSRHYGPEDGWTHNDAYVTVYHSNELGFTTNGDKPDTYLLGALSGELVTNNDLVVWIKASAHHEPSDEDRSPNDIGTNLVTGVTGVHWSGFDAEPHNFFNYNPMGAPVRCGS